MADERGVAIGIDLGTSSVKVLAIAADGSELARGAASYPLETPRPEVVEQDPELVYRAATTTLAGVLRDERLRGRRVAALGLSAAMHGILCVDEDGRPLSHAITWMDRRAHAIADGWRADGTGAALYASTGAPMHPMLPVAKLRWLRQHEPALFARTRRFVGLKELVVARWTGRWLVDHGIASATGMLGLHRREWDPEALRCAGVEPERLSAAAPVSAALPVAAAFAREVGLEPETRLVLASSDGALATIASAAGEGDVALTLGTSGAVRVLRDAPLLDPAARTFCYCADDRRFIAGGPTSGAGAALEWIFALLLDDAPEHARFARAAELANDIAPGADGLTVLPFFGGERAPYWEGALRGAFEGLDLSHSRATIVRAGFEGVVFGVRAVYEALRELAGEARQLVLSGGLGKEPLVRHLVADAFGMPVAIPHEDEASAFGAALVAAEAVGLVDDASRLVDASGVSGRIEPDGERRTAYDAAFARYRAAAAAALARLDRAGP